MSSVAGGRSNETRGQASADISVMESHNIINRLIALHIHKRYIIKITTQMTVRIIKMLNRD